MNRASIMLLATTALAPFPANADGHPPGEAQRGSDPAVMMQQVNLANQTNGKGFGPQSPRDIDSGVGENQRLFSAAPPYEIMNLCNIHFHKNAEHRGGEFTLHAGDGDGKRHGGGFRYSGQLSAAELAPVSQQVCPGPHDSLVPGDTIEVHYVHSTAQANPGPTLGSCLSDAISNPQLRVEAQVLVVVNDEKALDFRTLASHGVVNDIHQALNIPSNTGTPVQYAGSTTGPGYNEKGSPFQVSWSVRPRVLKVDIASVREWCHNNVFNEDHAHGVRNLVTHPELLSHIER